MNHNIISWLTKNNSITEKNIIVQDDCYEEGGYVIKIPISTNTGGVGLNLTKSNLTDSLSENNLKVNSLLSKNLEVESLKYLHELNLIKAVINTDKKVINTMQLVTLDGAILKNSEKFSQNYPNINGSKKVLKSEIEDGKLVLYFQWKGLIDKIADIEFEGNIIINTSDVRTLLYGLFNGLYNYQLLKGVRNQLANVHFEKTTKTSGLAPNCLNEIFSISFLRRIDDTDSSNI